ncbi:MAG: hypothetical protein Q4E49_06365 [Bacteroidales bacterium]|jgi:hypothetical protein|nr:hypothetical protein [Bacteroidales bacterium]
MTAVQMSALNAEILHNLGTIAEDEGMLKRVAKYLRRVVRERQEASTLMTKEAFFQKIEKARKQPGKSFANVEELSRYIHNL